MSATDIIDIQGDEKMGVSMDFYDMKKKESFSTDKYVIDHDKRGKRRAKTTVRGYPVYRYMKSEVNE
jgi:hypothetical protein